jgi:phosphoribosyl 1,2-cyclic phosphate phosphodiesterase
MEVRVLSSAPFDRLRVNSEFGEDKKRGREVYPELIEGSPLLGTSAGWPLPRLGCNCEICTSKDPKDTRTRTQLLINDSVLLDAGPDTYLHLIKSQNIKNLDSILVTHGHPDHILGFWDISHFYNLKKRINLYITLPTLNEIRKIFPLAFQKIKIIIVKPNQEFTISNAKVQYFPVIHGKAPTFGVKFKDGKILAYIPDFNRILPSQQKVIRNCHSLIIDGSSLGKIGQGHGHISINDGIQIAKNLRAKQTYFVHIGHKTQTHGFLEKYLKENAGPNFHIAYDKLEIQI